MRPRPLTRLTDDDHTVQLHRRPRCPTDADPETGASEPVSRLPCAYCVCDICFANHSRELLISAGWSRYRISAGAKRRCIAAGRCRGCSISFELAVHYYSANDLAGSPAASESCSRPSRVFWSVDTEIYTRKG